MRLVANFLGEAAQPPLYLLRPAINEQRRASLHMWTKPLPYHPKMGEVLRCDYSGLQRREMSKVRWVVVISPKFLNRPGLCTVVPISTSPPHSVEKYHVKLDHDPAPNASGDDAWVKCDMVMTVDFARLSAYYDGKSHGRRNYITLSVSEKERRDIQRGVIHALGLGDLCPPEVAPIIPSVPG